MLSSEGGCGWWWYCSQVHWGVLGGREARGGRLPLCRRVQVGRQGTARQAGSKIMTTAGRQAITGRQAGRHATLPRRRAGRQAGRGHKRWWFVEEGGAEGGKHVCLPVCMAAAPGTRAASFAASVRARASTTTPTGTRTRVSSRPTASAGTARSATRRGTCTSASSRTGDDTARAPSSTRTEDGEGGREGAGRGVRREGGRA